LILLDGHEASAVFRRNRTPGVSTVLAPVLREFLGRPSCSVFLF
jgi:hypothetical protein